jgi:hypothetical protein
MKTGPFWRIPAGLLTDQNIQDVFWGLIISRKSGLSITYLNINYCRYLARYYSLGFNWCKECTTSYLMLTTPLFSQ